MSNEEKPFYPFSPDNARKLAAGLAKADGSNPLARVFPLLKSIEGIELVEQENGMQAISRKEGHNTLMLKRDIPLNSFMAWTILDFLLPEGIMLRFQPEVPLGEIEILSLLTGEI